MGVIGLGTDVVEIERIRRAMDRHPGRFVDRICRPGEPKVVAGGRGAAHVAGLFAAKEAVLKALGTGWSEGMAFRDVEIRSDEKGRPEVVLHGTARVRAESLGATGCRVSISHDGGIAVATAVLEGR